MELIPTHNFIYRGTTQRIGSKSGEPFTLIELADPQAFQTYEFFLNIELPNDLTVNDEISVLLELSRQGYNNNINIVEIKKV